MAILASIEVDDEGSLKIRNFRDALSDLGASVVKAKQEMAQANQSGANSTKQQVDAITQLTAAARAAQAETQKYAQGWSVIQQQMTAGSTVTQVQAAALQQLSVQTQSNTQFTQQYGAALANLSKSMAAGAQVTPQMAQALAQVAAGYQKSTQGTVAQTDALTKLIAAENAALAVHRQSAQGFSILQTQMKAGATVTQAQADALKQLSTQTQSNTAFTQKYGVALSDLVKQTQAGATITPQLAKQVNDLANAHNKAAKEGEGQANSLQKFSLQAAATAAAMGLLAGELFGFLREASEAAARIQTLGIVLNVVGKNAGISRHELQTQIEGVKQLGITTKEATDTVLQFVQAQLKVADATKIARAAQDLAVVAGENSSQTVQRLTQAIQTGETMLLRQVGIVTTNEAIWREYAKTVGKNVNQLDALDKKQAMVNKILSEAQKVAGAYEQAMGTAGKQLTSFARYTEEAQLKIGEALVPALGLAIEVATAFLKAFMALSPETMKFVSALLAAAAAMAVFSAAVAGAKLIGIVGLFADLATNIGRVAVAAQNGMGLWSSLVGVFGGWGLAITGVAVAIGALTAAYIYFNKTVDLSVDTELKAAAVSQSRIDLLKTTTEKIIDLGNITNRTTGEQTAYNQAIATLTKIAPSAVQALGELQNRYDLMVPAVQAVIEKEYELMRVQARALKDKADKAEEERKLSGEELKRAQAEVDAIKKKIAAAKGSGGTTQIEFTDTEGRVFKAAATVETLTVGLQNAQKAAAEASAKFAEMSVQAGQNAKAFENLNNALPENVMARGKAIAAEVANEFLETAKAVTNLKERLKVAGKGEDYLKNAADVPAFRQRLTEINNAWDKHVKQMETDAKKVTSAIKAFYASIRDSDPVDMAKYKAASVLLKEVGEGTEEYGRRVQKLRPILDAYAKSTDPAVKGIKALQTALDSLTTKAYEDALEKGALATEKLAESLNDKLVDATRNAAREITTMQEEMGKKLFNQRLEQADRIEEVNRTIYEQEVVAKMSSVDQAIYAEQKKFDAIAKGYAREKLLRDRALEEERRAVDRKAELAKEEIKIYVDKANREAELALARQRNVVENMLPGVAKELAAAELRAAEVTRQKDRAILDSYQKTQTAQIETHRVAQQKILDQQAAANAQIDKSNQELLGKQKKAMENAVAEIIKNWRGVGASIKALGATIAESFLNGLKEMGPGAKSFKDVLMGVFDSIKNAFMSMVNSMVQKWIDGLFKMKAADQAGGLTGGSGGKSGFSLFGKGQSTGQKALGGAAVGFMAGDIAGRYADGSYAKGALGGAASGAAAGAAVGGWVGAGVGAIAGGIAGFMQARAQRKQMQEDRDALVKDMGGLEAFKKKAQEAGFAYEKFLSTKSPKEFGQEVKKLQEALDKLELAKSREELIKTSGGFAALSKSMELVGFNSKVLFNTKSVTEYNAEVEKLNKMLAEQQKRLEALGAAAGGLDTAAKGLAMRLDRALTDIGKKMGKAQADALEEAFKKAQEGGFKGSQNSFILDQIRKAQAGGKDAPKIDTKTMEAYIKAQKDAQKEFNTLGLVATTTFAQILSETGDIVQAMNAIGPSLDQLITLSKDWGLESSGAFQKLLQLRQVITENEDVVTSLSGITQIIKGLSEAGALTAEVFNAMGSDAATMFQTLLDRGVDSQQAMLLMQPTLQALWEAQKEFGFQTDEATQALLDQAEAAGMVGQKQQAINKQMLDVLLLIAKALGADIPNAYEVMQQKAEDAAAGAAGGLDDVTDRAREAAQAYKDMGDAAEEAGRRAEGAATGAAEGHSPTGIKQIIVRLKESQAEYDKFAESAVDAGKVAEDAATAAAMAAEAARFKQEERDNPYKGAKPERAGEPAPGAPEATVPPSLTIQISPEFNINALDGSDVERVVREQVGPQLLDLALTNTDQFTILFEQALERYRRT